MKFLDTMMIRIKALFSRVSMKFASCKRRYGARNVAIALSLALILTFAIGGTIAFLATNTQDVKNSFAPSQVSCVVEETFENNVKTNVTVKNTSDIDAYLRAAVVVTWQNANGDVLGVKPVKGEDFTMKLGDGWDTDTTDGYYYYPTAVKPGESTEKLIEKCEVLKAAPEAGYTLHVEIIASAIQAEGEPTSDEVKALGTGNTPVEQAWGVKYDASTKTIEK